MSTHPRFAVILPLIAEPCRHGVGEPVRDEIDCPLLLPVRQAVFRVSNVSVRIEEAQLSHRGRMRES